MALELKITIDELLIRINTNIPDKSLAKVDFNRNLLHFPKESRQPSGILNSYPFFTSDIEYPFNSLENLDYVDRVEFFFNKDEFTRRLRSSFSNKELGEDEIKSNSEKNVLYTLRLLFPTTFPVVNNLHQSYNYILKNDSTIPLFSIFHHYNPFNFKGSYNYFYYSYLKLNGKIYTFKKITWLNDVLNNPVYQKIFIEYNRIIPSLNKYIEKQRLQDDNVLNEISQLIIDIAGENGAIKKGCLADNNACPKEPTNVVKNFQSALNNIKSLTRDDYNSEKEEYQNKIADVNFQKFIDGGFKFNDEYKKIIQDKLASIQIKMRALEESYKINKTLTEIFEKPYNSQVEIPDEFKNELRNFLGTTLSQYKRPIRISSNYKLQKLLEQKTNEDVKNFFIFLNDAYKSFINEKDFNDEIKSLMNIGISTLTPGTVGQRKKEIHIKCDFIGGEVNKENVADVYCPFTNDLLANKTIDYIEGNNINTSFWQVKQSAPVFDINSMESVKSADTNIITNTNKNPGIKNISNNIDKTKITDTINNPPKSILKAIDEGAKTNFQSKIIFPNTKLLDKYVDNLKRFVTTNQDTSNIQTDFLYDYIQANDNSLLQLINTWNKRQDKNVELIVLIQTKIKEFEAAIENNETLYINKLFSTFEDKNKTAYNKAKLELKTQILKLLKNDEESKQNLYKGGKKKSIKKVKFVLLKNKTKKCR